MAEEERSHSAAAASAIHFPSLGFSQVFGERLPGDEVQEGAPRVLLSRPSPLRPADALPSPAPPAADVLSAIEFDATGEQLATGDRGGRVVLFERTRGDAVRRARSGRGRRHAGGALERRRRTGFAPGLAARAGGEGWQRGSAPQRPRVPASSPPRFRGRAWTPVSSAARRRGAARLSAARVLRHALRSDARCVSQQDADSGSPSRRGEPEYRYLTEFQSHEPEVCGRPRCDRDEDLLRVASRTHAPLRTVLQFDYLKSLEIEEKINKIRWCQQGANAGRFLLSANDKTIKLWKVVERRVRSLTNFNVAPDCRGVEGGGARPGGGGDAWRALATAPPGPARAPFPSPASLRVPRCASVDSLLASRCRRTFPNAHAYHINSLSCCSDGQTFLSADDLRVNLWSLEAQAGSFTIVDIKPESMENLTEVITAAVFHPRDASVFAYASSKGAVRLGDMRARALCGTAAKLFEEPEAPPAARSFFSEIIASISDVQFGAGGRFLLSRDYMNLKLWDVAMEARPLATYPVHEPLRARLCDLYENDAIFDKFECVMSGDGALVATGTYSNLFRVFSTRGDGASAAVEASKDPTRTGEGRAWFAAAASASSPVRSPAAAAAAGGASPPTGLLLADGLGGGGGGGGGARVAPGLPGEHPLSAGDYGSKLLHLAWHPREATVAAAAGNSLYSAFRRASES